MGMSDETKGGLIGLGGSILGAGINAGAQGSMNKKTREWNEKMYNLQRENALADWNMQNQYNSPEQQMARLKAAGLNPNLVYGNGATATSSSMPRGTEAKSWQPKAPQFDVGSTIGAYQDVQIKKQTLTNMDAQEKVLRQEALNKAADLITKGISQKRGALAYDIEQNTRENVIGKAQHVNDLLAAQRNRVDAGTRLDEERSQRGYVQKQLEVMAQQIAVGKAAEANIRQAINNAKKDGIIKDFEIDLNKTKLTKSDPAYMRLIKGLFDEILKMYQ